GRAVIAERCSRSTGFHDRLAERAKNLLGEWGAIHGIGEVNTFHDPSVVLEQSTLWQTWKNKEEHVPTSSQLSVAGADDLLEHQGMRRIEHHRAFADLGVLGRNVPGDGTAPVVANDNCTCFAQVPDEIDYVACERVEIVWPGAVSVIVAAQIGGDDAETGLGERRDLIAPGPPEFREAVEQEHQRASTLGDVVHPN